MYDRRQIMLTAHRDYEARVSSITANVNQANAYYKKARKPLRSLGSELRSLWKTCLRQAWAKAKSATVAAQPQTLVEQIQSEILFEEAADRGYDAVRVSALRDRLAAARQVIMVPEVSSLTNDPTLKAFFGRLEDGSAPLVEPCRPRHPMLSGAVKVRELVEA